MELVSFKDQKTIINMIDDVNRKIKIPGFKFDGSLYEKGKYEDALKIILDSFDEIELSERLINVSKSLNQDWMNEFSENDLITKADRKEVQDLFNNQGLTKLVDYEEIDQINSQPIINNSKKKWSKKMPELTQEQKDQYVKDQKRLREEYSKSIDEEIQLMTTSKENYEKAINDIANTSKNLSLTNRLHLAQSGQLDDKILTRQSWNKLGFYPKGEKVTAYISSPNGTFTDENGKERPSFKQQAVYSQKSFENEKGASMAFDERFNKNGLGQYDSTIKNEAYQAAVHKLGKEEGATLEVVTAKYLYRRDHGLIKHDQKFELPDVLEIPSDSKEMKKTISNISKSYQAIDDNAQHVAFAKEQQRAQEKDTPEAKIEREEDEGLTLS